MRVVKGEIALAQPVAPLEALGQFVRPLASAHFQRRAHGLAHGARRHPGHGFIHRHNAALALNARANKLHFAPAYGKTAVEQKLPAGVKLFFEPRLVVPHGHGVAAGVGDAGAGDEQPRGALLRRIAHNARQHRAFQAGPHFRQGRGRGQIPIGHGQAHHQIAQCAHARLFKRLKPRRAEPRQAGKFQIHHSTAMR